MAYTPNPVDATQPTEDKFVESAAAEFRALKGHVNTEIERLDTDIANLAPGGAISSDAQADIFTCDGVQTVFSLYRDPGRLANLDVSIGGVTQRPGVDYNWTSPGTTLIFTVPPIAGVQNLLVRYTEGLPPDTTGTLRSDLSNTTELDLGDALIGVKQPFTGSVAKNQHQKNAEFVSVKDFGAVGDGVTNDTAAFLAAVTASKLVFVPDSQQPYVVSGLNVPLGSRIFGSGLIKTGSGNTVNLSTVDMAPDDGPMHVIFCDGPTSTWEEMLDMKSCGFNTVMPYLYSDTYRGSALANCRALGMKILMYTGFVRPDIANWPALAAQALAYDAEPEVIGYYVFDEPVANGITKPEQANGMTLMRAGTAKPLGIAENAVVFTASAFLILAYDFVLTDQYFLDTAANGNVPLYNAIRNLGEFSYGLPHAKIIPLVGLFNGPDFTKSATLTVQLADVLVKMSRDNSWGAFIWDPVAASLLTNGVRNTLEYRKAAKRYNSSIALMEKWKVHSLLLGPRASFVGKPNGIKALWTNTTDAAILGNPGASNLIPWYVENVGVITDMRHSSFEANGLAINGAGGNCGFAGMPSGINCSIFRFDNYHNASTVEVKVGSSFNLGFTRTNVATLPLASTAESGINKQLAADGDFTKMPTLQVDIIGPPVAFPNAFLSGYMIFTDIPEVTF